MHIFAYSQITPFSIGDLNISGFEHLQGFWEHPPVEDFYFPYWFCFSGEHQLGHMVINT
jgi:hypothetical protein